MTSTHPVPGARRRRAASLSQAVRWQLVRLLPTWRALLERTSARPPVAAAARPVR